MSYLNNTDEGGPSSSNQLILFMALAMGGFALYTAFFAPQQTAPPSEAPVAAEVEAAEASPAEAAGDTTDVEATSTEVL